MSRFGCDGSFAPKQRLVKKQVVRFEWFRIIRNRFLPFSVPQLMKQCFLWFESLNHLEQVKNYQTGVFWYFDSKQYLKIFDSCFIFWYRNSGSKSLVSNQLFLCQCLPWSDREQADLIKIVDHLGADSVVLGATEHKETPGVYVDSLQNPLTYFGWHEQPPTGKPFITMKFNMKWRAENGWYNSNILCVKCHPSYYRGPQTFSEIL